MKNKSLFIILLVFVAALSYLSFFWNGSINFMGGNKINEKDLYAKFQKLSTSGNSSCSKDFSDSISLGQAPSRLQGSCCSPMNWHRYSEQIKGLKKFSNIREIPPDPYDIEADLAKKMQFHYNDKLTKEEQKAYDYAMENSMEKGPCCCKCWRWYVYGGLAKFLIKEKGFTGEQVTEVWNLSDGCGGEGDHVNHG